VSTTTRTVSPVVDGQPGIWVLDQVTRRQSVNWDFSGRLQKAQLDVVVLEPDLGFRLGG
jgi:hypothetical protein